MTNSKNKPTKEVKVVPRQVSGSGPVILVWQNGSQSVLTMFRKYLHWDFHVVKRDPIEIPAQKTHGNIRYQVERGDSCLSTHCVNLVTLKAEVSSHSLFHKTGSYRIGSTSVIVGILPHSRWSSEPLMCSMFRSVRGSFALSSSLIFSPSRRPVVSCSLRVSLTNKLSTTEHFSLEAMVAVERRNVRQHVLQGRESAARQQSGSLFTCYRFYFDWFVKRFIF